MAVMEQHSVLQQLQYGLLDSLSINSNLGPTSMADFELPKCQVTDLPTPTLILLARDRRGRSSSSANRGAKACMIHGRVTTDRGTAHGLDQKWSIDVQLRRFSGGCRFSPEQP